MNDRQTVFVAEYLRDFNATRAAKAAGYSAKTAREIGSNLLTNVDVAEAVKAAITERCMKADETLLRLAEHARADMQDFLDITSMGFQVDLKKAQELGKTHLIRKLRQKVTTIVTKAGDEVETIQTEIELQDQQQALALLAKHHGLLVERQDITTHMPVTMIEVTLPEAPDDGG